ncbi:MAG: hypothetical protein P4L33_08045 [Capsulimonadaceae bacterium]|nr:hypothetical protein [Capsulimonadaceae bacterium]
MEHASDHWSIGIFVAVLSIIILYKIVTAQRGKPPTIRRIAGLNAIDEAVGRATEMGRPILMVPGIGGLDIPALQALNIFGYIGRSVARFGNRTILAVADPQLVGVGEEVIRDAYTSAGRPELFNAEDVRFLSDRQFAFASGVAGVIEREKVAASFLMGAFFAESLIIAEVGQRVGAIQVAATNQFTQLPFFIATCDYVLLGDEFYAASAYLSKNPTLLGSIVGQDYAKLLILIVVILGTLSACGVLMLPAGHVHDLLQRFMDLFKS